MIPEYILDTMLICLTLPLLLILIKIYYKSRLNTILLLLGIVALLIATKITGLLLLSQPYTVGYELVPTAILYYLIPIILSYYLIKDHMWTLLTITLMLTMFSSILALGLGYEMHGETGIIFALIIWSWYKESGRCFNPISCPLTQLELKYLHGGERK